MSNEPENVTQNETATTRRRMLMLGAVSVSTVVTIKPALASTAVSALNCEIPVPDPTNAGKKIAADGSVVPAETSGAFDSPGILKGEDVRRSMLRGRTYPGRSVEATGAYNNYINRLQSGTPGFTCFASVLNARG